MRKNQKRSPYKRNFSLEEREKEPKPSRNRTRGKNKEAPKKVPIDEKKNRMPENYGKS